MTPFEWFSGGLLLMILAHHQEPRSWYGITLAAIGIGWTVVAMVEWALP